MAEFAIVYVVLAVLGLLLAVAWICLPFALFGMKPLLRHLIREVETTNRLLSDAQPAAKARPVDAPVPPARPFVAPKIPDLP